jgi:cysteine desulfurase
MNRKSIYLDYAATTPVDPQVIKAMEPYLRASSTGSGQAFGNASSVHFFGQQAVKAVDKARVTIAQFLNCQPTELIFTSGATESNNAAIKGVIFHFLNQEYRIKNTESRENSIILNSKFKIPHVVTTAIEHPSVLESCQALKQIGLAEVTYVKPQSNGVVSVENIMRAIKANTVLVSVMYANNEVGTIQPVRAIGRELRELKELKELREKRYPLFHTDAAQAVQFLPCRVDKLGVDLLSMSGHKIYGPKGVGALYVKKGTPIRRFIDGGTQEFDLRAGTLNTPGIVGLGKAVGLLLGLPDSESDLASSSDSADPARSADLPRRSSGTMPVRLPRASSLGSNLAILRDKLIEGISEKIPNTSLNGDQIHRLPNNINIRFNGVDAQTLVMALDQEGIAVSAGSACASGAPAASHVISEMLGEQAARESVRFTIGKWTTKEEIDLTIVTLQKVVSKMRSNSF